MQKESNSQERVIGLDVHPDTFTAAAILGQTPAQALVEKIFNKVPMAQLEGWAKKHTGEKDVIVMEASGNSFQTVRRLEVLGRKALVLESCQMGKLKEAHASNDKISAVRIGKAFLSGTAKRVWVPDPETQERRDWFHAYKKAVKRATQMRQRISSYLSDNGVRLKAKTPLTKEGAAEELLSKARQWSPRQWQVIQGMLMELRQAEVCRKHWRSLIAQEVVSGPMLLSIVRLCGVRDMIAFALGAIIGDIHRFETPRKLVKYIGLNPAFEESGKGRWEGGIGGHGRKDLRGLLVEAAHAVMRSGHPLAKWGKKLLARKSEIKLTVAAVARKLTVALWYLLMGRWTPQEEIDARLSLKIGKIISQIGATGLNHMGKTRMALRKETRERLKTGRTYTINLQARQGI